MIHKCYQPVCWSDNCYSWISGRGRIAVEIISWPNRKYVLDVGIELGAACMPSGHASDRHNHMESVERNTWFYLWSVPSPHQSKIHGYATGLLLCEEQSLLSWTHHGWCWNGVSTVLENIHIMKIRTSRKWTNMIVSINFAILTFFKFFIQFSELF